MTESNRSIFVLVAQRTAWWPVTFSVPAEDDAGYVIEQKIEMKFAFISDQQLGELQQRARIIDIAAQILAEPKRAKELGEGIVIDDEAKSLARLSPGDRVAEVYMKIVKDWRGVGSANDQPIPFNRDNFAMLLQSLPGFDRRSLLPAYIDCISGEGKVRAGN